MPKGIRGFQKGKDNPSWKGGKPKCIVCGKVLDWHSPSSKASGKYCKSCSKKGEKNPLFGKSPWNKGLKGFYHASQKTKEKISESLKGHIGWNAGLKGYTNKGSFKKGCISYMKGKHHAEETKEKMRGRKLSEEQRARVSGENSPNWNGGISPLNRAIRTLFEYKQWRLAIYGRDNYTCVGCGHFGSKNLQAHHIKPFSELYAEFLQEYNQLSSHEDHDMLLRLGAKWQPFWDIDNGSTLCKDCHKLEGTYKGKSLKKLSEIT